MQPVNEWIKVKTVKEEEVSEGGIILTAGKKNHMIKKSVVIAISDDVYRLCKEDKKDLPYKVGDIVYHHAQLGISVPISMEKDNDEFFLKYDGIMAVD